MGFDHGKGLAQYRRAGLTSLVRVHPDAGQIRRGQPEAQNVRRAHREYQGFDTIIDQQGAGRGI